jgi:hypothetical protein
MPNALLDTLAERYRSLSESYDAILVRCSEEKRQPNDIEEANLIELRSQMEPLTDRLVELRADEDKRFAAMTALTDIPDITALPTAGGDSGGRTPLIRVRSEPELYRNPYEVADPDDRHSFFIDLYDDQINGNIQARSRLERHDMQIRAASNTNLGAGVVPPNWLFSEFAAAAHGARPWADTLRRLPLTDANPITIGIQTNGAKIGDQGPPVGGSSENVPPLDGDFEATPLVTVPRTKTGKVDVSRQLLDGSNPAVDGLIFGDAMGAYAESVETMVVAAFTALVNPPAAGGIAGNVSIDLSDPDAQFPDAVIDAGVLVRTHRRSAPNVLFCSEITWGIICKTKDAAGRPLVVTGYQGPNNARGLGEAIVYGHVAGNLVGLQAIPSWAGVDAQSYVVKADDLLLLESNTMQFRYEEVLGPQTIRLGVWGYVAVVLARYPKAICRITALNLPFIGSGNNGGNGGGETTPPVEPETPPEPEPEHSPEQHRPQRGRL